MRGTSLLPTARGTGTSPMTVYGETRRFGLDLRYWIDVGVDRKLVLDFTSGEARLFDATDDPDEVRDLARVEPKLATALERDLRDAVAEMESRAAPELQRGTLTAFPCSSVFPRTPGSSASSTARSAT